MQRARPRVTTFFPRNAQGGEGVTYSEPSQKNRDSNAPAERWSCLKNLFVTIGDDVFLIPTQIINLAQAMCDVLEQDATDQAQHEKRVARAKKFANAELPKEPKDDKSSEMLVDEESANISGEVEPCTTVDSADHPIYVSIEDKLVELMVECVMNLPVKTGMYASIIGILYKKTRTRDFCLKVLNLASLKLGESFSFGRFIEGKLLLRFLIGLASSHVISLTPLIHLIKSLLHLSKELPQTTAEQVAHATMASIPWLSVGMYQAHHADLIEVLDCPSSKPDTEMNILLRSIQPINLVVDDTIESADSVQSICTVDRLASLLDAIDSMIDAEWQSRATLRFYQSRELQSLLTPVSLDSVTPAEVPLIEVNEVQLKELVVPPVETVLRLPVSVEKVDVPLKPHDRWILEDHLLSTIKKFSSNINLCAEQVLRVPVDDPQFEYILGECLLSELLRLPRPPIVRKASDSHFLYVRIIHRVCQLQNSMVKVIETLLGSLVKRAVDFDHETMLVLSDFFAYWLNVWGGTSRLLEEWLDMANPSPYIEEFVRRSLEKSLRMNYPETLTVKLPACASSMCPPLRTPILPYISIHDSGSPPDEKFQYGNYEFQTIQKLLRFTFEDEDTKIKVVQNMYSLISSLIGRRKCIIGKAESASEEVNEKADSADCNMDNNTPNEPQSLWNYEEELDSPQWTLEDVVSMFVYALFSIGSKTMTHMQRLLDNYTSVFTSLREINADNLKLDPMEHAETTNLVNSAVIRTVLSYYEMSQQKSVLSLLQCTKSGILSRISVVKYICELPRDNDTRNFEIVSTMLQAGVNAWETKEEDMGDNVQQDISILLQFYIHHLLQEMDMDAANGRNRFLHLRLLHVCRKYAKYIYLEDINITSTNQPVLKEITVVVEQVRKLFYNP